MTEHQQFQSLMNYVLDKIEQTDNRLLLLCHLAYIHQQEAMGAAGRVDDADGELAYAIGRIHRRVIERLGEVE